MIPLLVAVLSATGCGPVGEANEPEPREALAIVDVTVLPMDSERLLAGHTVIVRDGVIVETGPSAAVPVPAGAHRIDGRGLYLMPGLVDAHVHLRDPIELLSHLAHGVTTVVHLSGPTGNVPDVLALRDRVSRGSVAGPTILTSGRILDGDPAVFPGVSTVVRDPEEAARAVGEQVAAGADVIKVYNNLPAEALRAVTRAAHARGVTVWGHVPRVDGRDSALQRAAAAGLDVIAHGEEVFFTMLYGEVEGELDHGLVPTATDDALTEAARLIRESGAAVIPNLSFVAMTRALLDDGPRVWSDPEAGFLHPSVRSLWQEQNPARRPDLARFELRERGKQEIVRRLTRALSEAGVPLLLGTDASAPGMFPGQSAHVELEELVAAGLTPYHALETATRIPGSLLRSQDAEAPPFGTVVVGARADLLLLEGDPSSDVSNARRIVGVVSRGTWYERGAIDRMRSTRAAGFPDARSFPETREAGAP